jgi:hypothetical protein
MERGFVFTIVCIISSLSLISLFEKETNKYEFLWHCSFFLLIATMNKLHHFLNTFDSLEKKYPKVAEDKWNLLKIVTRQNEDYIALNYPSPDIKLSNSFEIVSPSLYVLFQHILTTILSSLSLQSDISFLFCYSLFMNLIKWLRVCTSIVRFFCFVLLVLVNDIFWRQRWSENSSMCSQHHLQYKQRSLLSLSIFSELFLKKHISDLSIRYLLKHYRIFFSFDRLSNSLRRF